MHVQSVRLSLLSMQICNVLFTVDVVLVEALDILIAIPIQRKPSMDIKQDGSRSLKRDAEILVEY